MSFGAQENRIDVRELRITKNRTDVCELRLKGNHTDVRELRHTRKSPQCAPASANWKIALMCTSFGSLQNRTNVHELRLSGKSHECAQA